MKTLARLTLLASAALVLAAPAAFAQKGSKQKLYRWVDDKGVIHYTDSLPPDSAGRDHQILNDQGVPVGFEQGRLSDAEKAAQQKKQKAEQAQQQAREEVAKHDRMLLETYLTVHDIEELRDRRLELLDSQIKVTELYLKNLHKRLDKLQAEAAAYRQPAAGGEPRAVPDDLSDEISKTAGTISSYETMLERTRNDQNKLRESFAADIARFKELKGG